MEQAIEERIADIRQWQAKLKDVERALFWEALREGYCQHCGTKEPTIYSICHCTNDE